TPVIGGGLSALEETIQHNVTGFVFRKQKNLAPLIIRLLKNPTLLKKIGRQGRARAQAGFGWDMLSQEWKKLFAALLTEKKFIPKKH
ncbi:MAG: glycosyltransferase, partial [bacterium]|nr:glycosyltransferase [bacterium]